MSLSTVHTELHILHLQNDQIKISHITNNLNQEHHPPASSKWQPAFHLTAPSGWLNDPCGLGYDPSTGLYHVSFQWNPKGNDWGNVSWGSSTSADLVSWQTSAEPQLTPSTKYDRCGVFTGCMQPTDVTGEAGALTCIYTSVSHLPIHYTLPYVRGCESLSIAVSRDGGATWRRLTSNPILSEPPSNLKVTGWRDPFVGPWRSMQRRYGSDDSVLYGFISGGLVGQTPTVFVYTVNPTDLRDWKFISCLVDVGLNFRPSRWSGDFGVNWEVANMLDLGSKEEGISRSILIVSAEGCIQSEDGNRFKAQSARTPRKQLWMALKTKSTCDNTSSSDSSNDSTLATYSFAGIFDHGCYYAANSFYDPVTDRHVVYGWITEEDLPDTLRHAQGWSGLLSLPRTVQLEVMHDVARARRSQLQTISSIETEADCRGTYTVRTLGIRPDERVKKLRAKASRFALQDVALRSCFSSVGCSIPLQTLRWEVEAEFAVHKQCSRVGIRIAHSADLKTFTIISWQPITETFIIQRPYPTHPGINHSVERAPHTLFTFRDAQDNEIEERLRIRAIFDKSVLEVFVNERTALSTRLYVVADRCFGLSFFAEGEVNRACDRKEDIISRPAGVLLEAQVWDGLEL